MTKKAKKVSKILLPAHAGVILKGMQRRVKYRSAPRTRGGDPGSKAGADSYLDCSPHTRG